MGQRIPAIGEDVSALMPPVGADVTSLMGGGRGGLPPADLTPPIVGGGRGGPPPSAPMPGARPSSGRSDSFIEGLVESVNPIPVLKAFAADTGAHWAKAQQAAAAGDYGGAVLQALNAHPVTGAGRVAMQIGQAQWDQLRKARDDFKRGRITEAQGRFLAGLLPLLGPAAANAGETIAGGEFARGAGQATGVLAPMAKGVLPKGKLPAVAPNRNAVMRDAVAFGEREGIPIDAATATGSEIVGRLQERAGDTMGGAGIAERFKRQQQEAFTHTGQRLSDRAHPSPVTAEQAGQSVRDALGGKAAQQHAEANAAYDALRQLEAAAPSQPRAARSGGKVESMKLAVDIRPTKAALKPIFDDLAKENSLVPFQSGSQKGKAFVALSRLMDAPDFSALSIADGALGELKALARVDDMFRRTAGQGIAAEAVKHLDDAVVTTARQAGPDVLKALMDGRKATIGKHRTVAVLDTLHPSEPVRVFDQLTARQDSAVARLREVAREAPAEMPKIARAFLDGLMEKATDGGGFEHAAAIASQWEKLGPQTKAVLFRDAAQIRDLDNFFRLARKAADVKNPSGTARSLTATNMAAAIPGRIAAKLLYSPRGVRLLTQGLLISPRTPAAAASWTAQMNTTLKGMGLDPLRAEEDQERTPTGLVGR